MANTLGDLVVNIVANTKKFDGDIDKAEKSISKFDKNLKTFGTNANKFVTVPLIAVATASTKFASDLGESLNAVNIVFGESADVITGWGETAATEAGLSQAAFNESSALIGTLLKKTGNDLNDVATDTIDVTKRAADLASVFNKDLSVATNAVGAALRGETEPIRQFAIDVSAAAVEAEALTSGLITNKNELTEAIKVQARYNLIIKQSENVAGDFKNTNNELANSSRVLKAELENAGAELGQAFLPIAKDVVSTARDIVKGFSELDEGTQSLVLGIATLTAGIAPAITTINTLRVAIAGLNPVVGALGLAIAGVVAGLNALEKANIKKANEQFGDLAESVDLTATEIKRVAEIAQGSLNRAFSDKNQIAQVFELTARQAGLTNEELFKILDTQGQLSEQQEEAISLVLQRADVEDDLNQLKRDSLLLTTEIGTEEETTKTKSIELTESQINAYIEQNNRVQSILDSNKSELELIDEQIASITELKLADSTFRDDQQKALELLQERKNAIIEEDKQKQEELRQTEIQQALLNADKSLQIVKERDAKLLQQEKDTQEKIRAERQKTLDNSFGIAGSLISLAENVSESEVQAGKKSAEEKYKAELAIFNAKKALAIIEIAVNTAVEASKVVSNPFLFGSTIALGATQAAVVVSQPEPPRPEFATGGEVSRPTNALIGEDRGEVLFGMGSQGAPLRSEFENNIAEKVYRRLSGSQQRMQQIIVEIDKQPIYDIINEGIESQSVRITSNNVQGGL